MHPIFKRRGVPIHTFRNNVSTNGMPLIDSSDDEEEIYINKVIDSKVRFDINTLDDDSDDHEEVIEYKMSSVSVAPQEVSTILPSFENSGETDQMSTDEFDSEESEPSPVPAVSAPTAPAVRPLKITNEESFWSEIELLNWRDRSDQVMNINSVRGRLQNRYSPEEFQLFRSFLRQYMDQLKAEILANGLGDEFCTDEVLSHVVAKGQVSYVANVEDPFFMQYLLPMEAGERGEAQSLWAVVHTDP